MSPEERIELRTRFAAVRRQAEAPYAEIAAELGARAGIAPTDFVAQPSEEELGRARAVERAVEWAVEEGVPPSAEDLEVCRKEADRLQGVYEQAREILVRSVGAAVPPSPETLS